VQHRMPPRTIIERNCDDEKDDELTLIRIGHPQKRLS
jgi:hypothetical protein